MLNGNSFSKIRFAPQISKTQGPNSVNASRQTIRGVVRSHWVRGDGGLTSDLVTRLDVTVPVGATAEVVLPLLVRVREGRRCRQGCGVAWRYVCWR